LLVESLVLSFAGGAVGLAIAFALTRGLLALVPSQGQPVLISASPDPRILTFTLSLTVLTGIVFGLLPALRASRTDPWTTMKDTMGSIAVLRSLFLRKGWSRRRWRSACRCLARASAGAQNLKTWTPARSWRTPSRSSCRRRSAATTTAAASCPISSSGSAAIGAWRQIRRARIGGHSGRR
jgi:hypothetical protein